MRSRAFLALGAAFALSGCARPDRETPATTLIGLDGADWRLALPLLRQGKLPHLGAIHRAGVSGVLLTNPDYRWSPVLWTTIATGRLPGSHGVQSFLTSAPGFDRPIPTPSTQRRCRALWNLFSERERTVGFVGWWATWPAEPVNGFMVSDHFSVSRFDVGPERAIGPAYREGETWPPELGEELSALRVERENVGVEVLARFADLPEGFSLPPRFVKFDKASEFQLAHSVDRTHHAVAVRLLAERRPELLGVFFQGLDIMQHFLWEFMDPQGAGTSPGTEQRRTWGRTIERTWIFADELVGSLVEAGGDERAVMIVSDHGFRPSTERWEAKGISGEHRRQALFLMAGPGVMRGQAVDVADAVDVTPTLMAYHGLEVAADLDGEPLRDVFTAEWRTRWKARETPTYETAPLALPSLPISSRTRDLEERIRSLGYVD